MFSDMGKMNKPFFVLFFMLTFGFQAFSQQGKAFKVRYQTYVKGDMAMIANNIVNRSEGVETANTPYNEITNLGKINDEFEMNYIDIDNDKSTFSSSSASLSLDNSGSKKIIYAGLYWTATYPCKSSKLLKKGRFEVSDAARETVDEIKIKLPNQTSYTSIKGDVIYDGLNDPDFKESAPYVVYKDITPMVKSLENAYGTYTIADVKATNGKISGGVAAGWTIFFVYEDSTLPGKSITTYDGFVGITEKSLDINFSGFKTVAEGSVNAKIACAALEGDTKLKGDQLLIRDSRTENFTSLSNTLRNKINVFNSSITMDDARFNSRTPNSANTLGFDSFLISIDNTANAVIGNNAEEAVVRLKTSGDRFFMFFNAFEVEDAKAKDIINEEQQKAVQEIANKLKEEERKNALALEEKVKEEQKNALALEEKVKEEQKKALALEEKVKEEQKNALALEEKIKEEQNKALVIDEKAKEEDISSVDKYKEIERAEKERLKEEEKAKKELAKVVTNTSEVASLKKSKKEIKKEKQEEDLANLNGKPRKQAKGKYRTEARVEPIESPSVPIVEAQKGYYIVANVFAVKSNAKRFKKALRKMGIKANYYFNPVNRYRYVYASKHLSFDEAKQLYYSNINGLYYDELWIMTVNLPKADTKKPEENNLTAEIK